MECASLWLKKLLAELKIVVKGLIKLYSDSKAAINIANNPVSCERTKHVEIDKTFHQREIGEWSFLYALHTCLRGS